MKGLKCMMTGCFWTLCHLGLMAVTIPNYSADRQKEQLGRGVVAMRSSDTTVTLTWRYLEEDDMDIAFNVYRATVRSGDGHEYTRVKKNKTLIRSTTTYTDKVSSTAIGPFNYYVVPVYQDTIEGDFGEPFYYAGRLNYIEIPMVMIPSDSTWTYMPTDISVGDLDGDGEYEYVIKREPDNSKDNSQSGVTSPTYLDAYELDGTFMWRINLGINIRSGEHYTQFMVYDLDGDGIAEVACKTADGTVDGVGTRIGTTTSYANSSGYILSGPEYFTIFNGKTGAILKTVNYQVRRHPDTMSPTPAQLKTVWGDNYGNRCDRYLAAVAYLDGQHPSLVICRGYYTRTVLWAVDWRDSTLTTRWLFDTRSNNLSAYEGQGFHSLRVADIDGDGKDEIIYGSCTIDDDGRAYHSTGWHHGDAIHLSDINPKLPGLEIWTCHEDKVNGSKLRSAYNDAVLISVPSSDDVGRCMMADIDPDTRGCEVWSSRSGGILSCEGNVITSSTTGVPMNMACWWDGGLNRNLLDDITITKWSMGGVTNLFTATGCASNHDTKATPCLQADVLGDWREEAIFRTNDNRAVRIYISPYQTKYRFHTFLQDPVYRYSVATENVAYNQPTQPSFYMGSDLENIIEATSLEASEDSLVIDPYFEHASAWKWSTGATCKVLTLRARDFKYEVPVMVKVEMTYRGYVFTDSVMVTFKTPAALAEAALEKIEIYPTSVEDLLYVKSVATGNIVLGIYDASGLLCLREQLSASATVDVSSLHAGVYFVRIEMGQRQEIRRIVKK